MAEFSISNIFGMGFELLVFAALVPVYINAINTILPHVGTVTKLILQLFVPAIAAMILLSGTEETEPINAR